MEGPSHGPGERVPILSVLSWLKWFRKAVKRGQIPLPLGLQET